MTQIAGYFNMGYLVNYKRWQALNEAIIFDKEKGGKFSHLLDTAMKIMDIFITNYKYPPLVAAAICGNIFEESKFKPTILSASGHYGLIQWGGNRRTKLMSLKNYNTIETQIDYINQELTGPYKKVMDTVMTKSTVESAADTIALKYEGASPSQNRRSAAKELFDLYQMNSENQPQLTANIDSGLQDLPVD